MLEIIILGLATVLDIAVITKLLRVFHLLKVREVANFSQLQDPPTISVCITARNEMNVLSKCLESVVASEYPKLEIIVLDDGSQDTTSIIIKSFAHAGVRFIGNKPLPEGWLGKNYAQSILAKEASGKYIFFLDVDTIIERHTIQKIISYALHEKASMVSIVPKRVNDFSNDTFLSTLRHFWNVIRFSPHSPQASSNAWLIERNLLVNMFLTDETLKSSLLLETTLATAVSNDNKYRLVISDKSIGISYEKQWRSEIETSIRLLYPESDAYILQVLWLVVIFCVFLSPYVLVWWYPYAFILIVLNFITALLYMRQAWSKYSVIGALWIPVTVLQELVLLFWSYYCYKRGTVQWKGRPITVKRQMQ